MNIDERRLSRRVVVTGGAGGVAAVAVLAACGNDSSTSSTTTAAQSSAAAAGATKPITRAADVPVGGGVIVDDVVVTQPTAGNYVGLSAECTHQGCKVSEVSGGTIDCRCHGSKFNLDGSVAHGPATRPLASHPVRVDGDSIVPA